MKIIYRIDIDGNAQLQNDETGTVEAIEHAAKRLGYVVIEIPLVIDDEDVEVFAMSPDTLTGAEKLQIERLVRQKYPMLKQIKRIKL
jgi:hypothetical protein